MTDDELKYAAKEWLRGQSELFYFTGIKNSEFAMNCALTKAVIMSKHSSPDYGLGTVGKCLGPTTSKGPTKDGCKIC